VDTRLYGGATSQENMDRTSIVNLVISALLVAQGVVLLPVPPQKTLHDYATKVSDLLHRPPPSESTHTPFRLSF
jgi:hypothetical protein